MRENTPLRGRLTARRVVAAGAAAVVGVAGAAAITAFARPSVGVAHSFGPDGDGRTRPEQMLIAGETRRELAALIAALPRHLRVALVLRHVEGLGYAEIAALLDAPVGTVKAHVHRGAKLLRTALETRNREEAKVEALR